MPEKSLGRRFISAKDAIDIIDVADLASWSEKASELSKRLIAFGQNLKEPTA